tara:strand:- start:181 stop:1911 length:1731 start_codon:yes stop_codon:yes gene_type:complete
VKNIKQQMNLFKYGGLKDDGRNRDPVSGNNVPSGSMAKEVRDDLPAMLSEGEYVVPADVVRYFGVNYFEDLRNKAKSGLTNMEKDGRIGGEPIDKPIMANEGALTTSSVTNPNRYTGEFSFERPGAGSYKYDGYEAPSPTTCAAKGKTYDPILRVCVTSPITTTPAVNIPAPVTYVPRVSTSGGGDEGPTKPEPIRTTGSGEDFSFGTDWYEKADWNDPQKTTDQFFDYVELPGVIGGMYGMQQGTTGLSKARAMENIYNLVGDSTSASIVADRIRAERVANKNLAQADNALDKMFGTDGDTRTIKILSEAGIDVDKNLRDEELQEYLSELKLNKKAVDRVKTKYRLGEGKFGYKELKAGEPINQKDQQDDEGFDAMAGPIEPQTQSQANISAARQNPITQGRLEGALGVASQGRPAQDHTGRDLSGLDPSDMNWNDVQALRSHDSAANRQKLAEWEASSKATDGSHSGATDGDSGCFLTTAIVEHRGEADDGPTLTKLRNFRDTYLADYPEEVKKYYQVAPKIVAAIPKDNPTWDWVGKQIDSAIKHIDNNMLDKAHQTYKSMVLELETNWLKKA